MVTLCGPIHLRACVSEISGHGEGAGSDSEERERGVDVGVNDTMLFTTFEHYRL